jgi:Poly (ADP-ribose) glycohydrolase (PARG), Macro domain fold
VTGPPQPIDRMEFDTAQLVAEHPPLWYDRNKQVVYEIACPTGRAHSGRLGYSRWGAMPLPTSVNVPHAATSLIDFRENFYDYAPALPSLDAVEWHVNFADPYLFVAYGSPLLAQDEMQVAEHPALGSLLEALNARGMPALTVEDGRPTPVLVNGVERRCRIAIDVNAAEGRPYGLYGGAFALADPEVVRRATHRIDPPTVSHIISMAAPNGGVGRYRIEEIEYVLVTAFTGFRAAVLESQRVRGPSSPVVIHTGYWGCGVFGGNRILMTILQMLAAEMAGVERLVLHIVDRSAKEVVGQAQQTLLGELSGAGRDVRGLVRRIEGMGLEWGVGDGN